LPTSIYGDVSSRPLPAEQPEAEQPEAEQPEAEQPEAIVGVNEGSLGRVSKSCTPEI
jgi:hypothetical protein